MRFFLIYLFLEVMISSWIVSYLGGLTTFIEIILSAVVGLYLLQNFKYAIRENLVSLANGTITQNEFMKLNLFVALGAVLLIIPGFMTDIIGVLLQFSFFASIFSRKILKKDTTSTNQTFHGDFREFKYKNRGDDDVIDVEIIDDKHTIDK